MGFLDQVKDVALIMTMILFWVVFLPRVLKTMFKQGQELEQLESRICALESKNPKG